MVSHFRYTNLQVCISEMRNLLKILVVTFLVRLKPITIL
jgi:hypothetical protein